MTDSCSGEKSLHELEFNDLNINLYLTLNYGTASEHLDFDFMVLYNAFVLSWGLKITQNSIRRISDLDRSRLTDTRSAENDRIGADTDPENRIDASLPIRHVFMFDFRLLIKATEVIRARGASGCFFCHYSYWININDITQHIYCVAFTLQGLIHRSNILTQIQSFVPFTFT